MPAPVLKNLHLALNRVRCSCQAENLVVSPEPWYKLQGQQTIEVPCRECGKSLLPMQITAGANHQVFGPEDMPLGVAAAVSSELAAEVTEAQDTPAEEVPLTPDSWSHEHEPSPAYLDWMAAQPAPAPLDRTRMIQNGIATAVLVAVVVICLLF